MSAPTTRNVNRARAAGANLLLVLAATATIFVVAEAVTRIVYHPENLGTVIQFDRHLGWSLRPGSHLHDVDNSRGLNYTIDVNSHGLREREIELAGQDGVRRILFVGDSFAFGVGVEAYWRCSDFVARALDDKNEVINAAVCGWGTDQELIHYQRFCRRLRPDVVVLTFCMSNDVLNNMLDHLYLGSAPKPHYVLSDSLELIDGDIEAPRIAGIHRLRRFLRQSRLLVLAKRRVDMLRPRRVGVPAETISHPGYRRADSHTHSHWSVFEREPDEDMLRAWDVTEAILERFADVCRRDGTDLIVLAFPLELEVDDEWRSQALASAGVDASSLDLEAPFDRLESICRRNGIGYLHPVEEFRVEIERRPLYFEKDVHPNEYGHAVAARAVLNALRERHGMEFHVAGSDRVYLDAGPAGAGH